MFLMPETKIKSDHHITLGHNIQQFRKERGYTQAYMVRELQLLGCNTTKQAYSKYEKEQAHITAYELASISKIFGVSLDKLFGQCE